MSDTSFERGNRGGIVLLVESFLGLRYSLPMVLSDSREYGWRMHSMEIDEWKVPRTTFVDVNAVVMRRLVEGVILEGRIGRGIVDGTGLQWEWPCCGVWRNRGGGWDEVDVHL